LTASIISFLFFLAAGLGISLTTDNIGDSLADIYNSLDVSDQRELDYFVRFPQSYL